MGCDVVGIDSSPAQVDAAKKRGLVAAVMDGAKLCFSDEFDAVFSNAALHWITRADDVIEGVYRALKIGGRFVGELGGGGGVRKIRAAPIPPPHPRGGHRRARGPLDFPTPGHYPPA